MIHVVKLTEGGLDRVLYGQVGMTFVVDTFTKSVGGRRIAHVRDYRYPRDISDTSYQIWSIGPEGYEEVLPWKP